MGGALHEDIFSEIEGLSGKAGDDRLKEMSDQLWNDNAYEKNEPDRVVLCVSSKQKLKLTYGTNIVMDVGRW